MKFDYFTFWVFSSFLSVKIWLFSYFVNLSGFLGYFSTL